MIAPTHYAGNGGSNALPGTRNHLSRGSASWSRRQWEQSVGYPLHVPGVNDSSHVNGVIGTLGLVRADDVPDGHSTTFLAGERYMNADMYFGTYCANDQGWTVGFDFDTVRFTGRNNGSAITPLADLAGAGGCDDMFGGPHQSGVMMVFCDGGVRSISYRIDPLVYRALGSRNASDLIRDF